MVESYENDDVIENLGTGKDDFRHHFGVGIFEIDL